MLDAAERLLLDAAKQGRRHLFLETCGEAWSLVRAGIGLRVSRLGLDAVTLLDGWSTEIRLAARSLVRAPAFSTVAIATLALGIGANAAILSLIQSVLYAPVPYEDPASVVVAWSTRQGSAERVPLEGPDVHELESRVRGIAGVAFVSRPVDGSIGYASEEATAHVLVSGVTPNLFSLLGVQPAAGRSFSEQDDDLPVVLSHATWERVFGSDPSIVGRPVRVNGIQSTVLGVLPEDFRLLASPDAGVRTDVDVWTPVGVPLSQLHRTEGRLLDQDSDNSGLAFARLAPGVSLPQVQAEAEAAGAALREEVEVWRTADLAYSIRPLRDDATEHVRALLFALAAGAMLVLLATCLNVATLLIGWSLERTGEVAVRSALGAGSVRLGRQFLTEALVLVAIGLVGAAVVAGGLMTALAGWTPPGIRSGVYLGLHPWPFAATGLVAVATTVLFSMVPALRARARATSRGLAAAGRGGHASRGRGRAALVAGEIACSIVLVLGAGILLRTVDRLHDVDPGFEPTDAVTFHLSMRTPDRYRSPGVRAGILADVSEAVGALPGVESVGLTGLLPLSGSRWTQPYGLPGQAQSEWHENRADFRAVSSGYFDALGARLLEGRVFTPAEDVTEEDRVVVIDARLAERIAPGGSALDAVIGIPLDGAPVQARVVGVVAHIRHQRLEVDGREAIFVPYRQEAQRDIAFVVRTSRDPAELVRAVQGAVRSVDPTLPVYAASTMEAYVAQAVAPSRYALALLSGFALLGLLCAALGLYGVVALEVRSRTREIGLRLAIGARPIQVVENVLGNGFPLMVGGLVAGVVVAIPLLSLLERVALDVRVWDPLIWIGAIATVSGVALLAALVPARRASRLSPVTALHAD